jgi:hypothetical protein
VHAPCKPAACRCQSLRGPSAAELYEALPSAAELYKALERGGLAAVDGDGRAVCDRDRAPLRPFATTSAPASSGSKLTRWPPLVTPIDRHLATTA